MKKEKTVKEIVQVMEYKGVSRAKLVSELIDALSYVFESDRVLVIDEEGNGGCSSLFLGTKNVSDQICDYLDEIDVPFTLMEKTINDGEVN